ncbi:MAG: hypothetical protein JW894_00210 [Bacteroidales bacterium]|nr:hypothetical protein [Bacteroidales bacterium]
MRYILHIILFLNINQLIISQNVVRSSDEYPEHKYYDLSGKVYFNPYIQIRGSAFLLQDWHEGDIKLKSGETIRDVKIKIDIYQHQVIVYQEYLNRIIKIHKNDVNRVVFSEPRKKEFIKIDDLNARSKLLGGCFVEVLTEGNISFYKLYYKEALQISELETPFIMEFYDNADYYISDQWKYSKVRLCKSFLKHKYPDKKSLIKQYIREQKLKLKKEEDFASVIKYLNTL